MILQDLIRNIVLYKGFINPFLQSVIDYVLQLKSVSKASHDEGLAFKSVKIDEIQSLVRLTGTHTIPGGKVIGLAAEDRAQTLYSAANGNVTVTLLVDESLDVSAQTYLQASFAARDSFQSRTIPMGKVTTGFFIENTYFVLSRETHEKREYLGEFSLSHEENQF